MNKFEDISQLVEKLREAKRLTNPEISEWVNNIKSIKLFAKRDEAAKKFYDNYKIQNRYDILTQEGIISPLEPLNPKELKRIQTLLTKYGYVINYLKGKGIIDPKRWKEYMSFLNDYKVDKDTQKFYNRLVAWYTRNNYPDLDKTYNKDKAEEKVKAATKEIKPNDLTDKGLDLKKIDPDKQDLVNSYIKTLEKITGKKISFQ